MATAALLGACGTLSTPANQAALQGSHTETVRELRHFGPQGKSAPIFVDRPAQACGAATPTLHH